MKPYNLLAKCGYTAFFVMENPLSTVHHLVRQVYISIITYGFKRDEYITLKIK